MKVPLTHRSDRKLVTLAVKSNRSLSGATSEPLWSASPRTFRSAKLSMWVAVWLLIIIRRRPCTNKHITSVISSTKELNATLTLLLSTRNLLQEVPLRKLQLFEHALTMNEYYWYYGQKQSRQTVELKPLSLWPSYYSVFNCWRHNRVVQTSIQELSYSACDKNKPNQRVKEALESSRVSVPYRLLSLWYTSFLLPSCKVSPPLTVSKL